MEDKKLPLRKMFVPTSFGTIEIAEWDDGHKSACFRLDRSLTSPPPEDARDEVKQRFKDFTDYGQIVIRPSDALVLMDLGHQLRPDLTYQCGGQ